MNDNTSDTSQDNNPKKQQNEEIGALWKRTSRNNMTYLAGHVKVDELGHEKTVKVVIFSNQNKQKDSQPDYRVYISNTNQRTDGNNSETETETETKAERKETQQEEELL